MNQYDTYHALLARQDAMRLRRRITAPAPAPARRPAAYGPHPDAYDGAADQRLITANLPLAGPSPELIDRLYDAMFEHHPYLRGLFPESMAFQRAHLERALRHLIDHLHRPDELRAFCTRLGRDHRKLGVRPVHYEVFEASLAEALRGCAGAGWSRDLEQAWLRMLRFAVAAMVAGAEEALAEPPYWDAVVTGHRLCGPDLAVVHARTAEPYPYRAGQYAHVQTPLLPHAWRPCSLACAPRPDGRLEFHVRGGGADEVFEALVARTGVGDRLRIGPAQGVMTVDGAPDRDVLIAATGTGWAAAKAILEELERRPRPPRTRLFLSAGTPGDLYDTPALAALEDRCPWLRVVPVLGGDAAADADHTALAEAVARGGDWSAHLAYVSGPPAMASATVRQLSALGVPADRIRHDLLTGADPLRPHRHPHGRPQPGPAVRHGEGAVRP
ncbi:Flavohemoprotein [Streptomyces sp. enrichment culture]|uniref:globin domain-containing protein n=1 Tax=Streptomyces sp. enrichment culture TaxID=1795815 RepID=UPI003F57F300